jgi:uncharacterized membrane protein YadS
VLLGGFSVLAVLLGTVLGCLANRYPRHMPTMELVAGWLLIAGFGLLGADLGIAFGPPMR